MTSTVKNDEGTTVPVGKKNASYQKWYANNKASFNEKRRLRYAKDSELQKKARENQAKRRAEGLDRPRRDPSIVRVTEAANMVGISVHFLRSLVKKGLVPKHTTETVQAMYSTGQVQLIAQLVSSLGADVSVGERTSAIANIKSNWSK
jgi:hypothetical protein